MTTAAMVTELRVAALEGGLPQGGTVITTPPAFEGGGEGVDRDIPRLFDQLLEVSRPTI